MHHRHHGWGRGPRMFFRGGFPSRAEMVERLGRRGALEFTVLIERLEGFQRDLEQQLADVADVLAHLRDRADEAPQQQI